MRLELRGVNVENKIYLNQYAAYWKASEKHKKLMGSNPAYDLSKLPAEKMQEEMVFRQRRSGRKRQIRSVSIPVQNLKCSKRQRQEPSVQLQVLPKHIRERDLALRWILPCRCWNQY